MKGIIIISISLVSILFFTSCDQNYPKHSDYSLYLEQSRYWPPNALGYAFEQFGLKLRLESTSDTLPPFLLMTCSWEEHAATNNESLFIGTACDWNFMAYESIKTDEYLELTSIAGPIDGEKIDRLKLRVALIVIDTLEVNFEYYNWGPPEEVEKLMDSLKVQEHRFVWSNEIELERRDFDVEIPRRKWTKGKRNSPK